MPRYSRHETYGDGQYTYDDRYDDGEFSTYGQSSHGPSSGAFSDGTSHYGHSSPYLSTSRPSRSSSSRHSAYDAYGYPIDGAYAGEEDLRRRVSRYQFDESTSSYSDQRTRLGRVEDRGYEYGRPSRLSQQVYVDDREARREARLREQAELERQLQLEQDRERRRAAHYSPYDSSGGDPYARSGRSRRRGAVTAENDPYLAYQQAVREEQQAAYDNTPSAVHGYGRGWFPSYEFR